MKPNYPHTFGLALAALLILYTNVATANNVRCVNASQFNYAPLTHPIMINWKVNTLGEGYQIKLNLTQVGARKGILTYSDILIPKPKTIEKVTVITNGEKIEMNKITFRDSPEKDSKIVIFETLDRSSYYLGYFKHVSPKSRSDDWRIMSDHFLEPGKINLPFIDSYYFIGGANYMENASIAQKLECDDSSD